MIVLAGMVISAVFEALVSLMKYVADPEEKLPAITYWLMGSLTGSSMQDVYRALPMIGIAVFVLWLLRPRPLPWQGRGELTFLLLGILGGTLYFWTENTALQHTFAANVSIIVAMAPILTSILAHFFTGDEKLHTSVWIGFAIAMCGVVLVVLNGALVLKLSPVGDLLAFLAAASWACYSVLIKRISGRVDSILLARRVILYGAVTALPLLAVRGELSFGFTPLVQPKLLFCLLRRRFPLGADAVHLLFCCKYSQRELESCSSSSPPPTSTSCPFAFLHDRPRHDRGRFSFCPFSCFLRFH